MKICKKLDFKEVIKKIVLPLILLILLILFSWITIMCFVMPKGGQNDFQTQMIHISDEKLYGPRQCGWVNLKLFSDYAKSKDPSFTFSEKENSVGFSTLSCDRYFGANGVESNMIIKYSSSLSISIDSNGFEAKKETIDSIDYVYIPYIILSNLSNIGDVKN